MSGFDLVSSRSGDNSDGDLTIPLDGTNGSAPTNQKGDVISVGNSGNAAKLNTHQMEFIVGDNNSGTLTITATGANSSTDKPVYESDGTTAVVIDLSVANEPETRTITVSSLKNIVVAKDSLGGSDDIEVIVSSGTE